MAMRLRRLAGLVAVALALGACSSSNKAATTTTSAPAPQGPPIVIGSVIDETNSEGTNNVPLRLGAEAAAAYINGMGGIGGRPVRIDACDSAADPATAAGCGNKFVADKV